MNGLLVLLLPLAFLAAGSPINQHDFDASVTADVPGAPRMWATIHRLIPASVVLFPLALFAGWRTWVYATRWCDQPVMLAIPVRPPIVLIVAWLIMRRPKSV